MKVGFPPRALDKGSLWLLTTAPGIWAAHLLLSYVTGAVWCAKFAGPAGSLGMVRTAVLWYTAVALVGIIGVGIEGFRRHRFPSTLPLAQGRPEHGRGATSLGTGGTEATTHDLDSPEDRHRFLGFATLLLAGLSAVAVIYAAMAATFFQTCR
jgi:hypothetical protein